MITLFNNNIAEVLIYKNYVNIQFIWILFNFKIILLNYLNVHLGIQISHMAMSIVTSNMKFMADTGFIEGRNV